MFTRDSAIWSLGIVGAIIVYLSSTTNPSTWTYEQWLQAAAFLVAMISGKLATSPLPGAKEVEAAKKNGAVNGLTRAVLPFVLLATVVWTACGPPKTVVTEPGRQAWYAQQVAIRVNQVMKFAVAAEETGALSRNDARLVVSWAVTANQVLAAMPAGWPTMVRTGWTEARAKLPAAWLARQEVQLVMTALDAILELLIPPPPATGVAWRGRLEEVWA